MEASALKEPLDEEMIDGIMGPTERRLRAADWERRREQMASGGVVYAGFEEFEAARKLYEDGQYRAAETAFRRLARQRESEGKNWWIRMGEVFTGRKDSQDTLFGQYGDPVHEDALFMTAECQFAQRRYSWAQDSYAALLEKYPSSRHLDDVTWRLFQIARYWLGVPNASETQTETELQLVSHESDGESSVVIEEVGGAAGWPLLPNLFDRTRPVFDTEGRAIQALETIWQHDATGPLADDALMLQATYAQRKNDFVEAARLYQLIREQYPDSSHFEDAFLLGSHVTLASYSGAVYDGQSLARARELKEIARTFPSLTEEQRARLERELENLKQAEVEREWARVELYLHKNQPASAAVYCNRILNRYPDTEYARRAWQVLQEQESEFNGRRRFPLWPFGDESDDVETEAEPPISMPGPPPPAETPAQADVAAPADDDQESRSWFPPFGNLLRPVERPPQLVQPPVEDRDQEDSEPARVRL
jgi:outer membrane protein assembly factor BamD (BamD/ComL family)